MLLQIGRLREALFALVTLVRFVARVNAHVSGQIERQRETLTTVLEWAGKGPLATVDQGVSFQLKKIVLIFIENQNFILEIILSGIQVYVRTKKNN